MVKTPAFHAGIVGSNPARVTLYGELAQLGEHLLCKQEVIGSNPLFSIGSYLIALIEYFGGNGEVWLTHRFVGPARVGSNPTYRPNRMRREFLLWSLFCLKNLS